MKRVLLTGVAGFIASRIGELLLDRGTQVVGLDNMNDYYDIRLKNYRLKALQLHKDFTFYKCDIEDTTVLDRIFKKNKFDAVINLAARAGVRFSLENPSVYMSTNVLGTLNLLEQCRKRNIKRFVLASTSSLYAGQKGPFKESLPVNTPISPYAASKKAAETIAHTYHYLYKIDTAVLRYFTVYGPAGRPDMSPFRFIKWIDEGKTLHLFGDGSQKRDFTYIDDVARGTINALKIKGYSIINLGGGDPHKINHMIHLIEKTLRKKAKIREEKFPKVDMKITWADTSKAKAILDWFPQTDLACGIEKTVKWYLENKSWLCKLKA